MNIQNSRFLNKTNEINEYFLPKLEFNYDYFGDFLSNQAMEIHHTKHHQTYINNLNNAIAKHKEWSKYSVEELLANLNNIPEDIRTAVKNHGGGHANHCLYWTILDKNKTLAKSQLKHAIEKDFGSLENCEEKLINSAISLFGSGWTWLCVDKNKNLLIENTQNQDSPLSKGFVPILTIDVWEHAYYLNYQNKRADFVKLLMSHLNWQKIESRYIDALSL